MNPERRQAFDAEMAATIGLAVGMVPTGNTGGTDVGMFERLPIAPGIRHLVGR